jgi:tRNA1Val (adenine37-N6)-methyltransferase
MEVLIKQGETLDDLQNGYYIIQKEKAFRFGVDAVLLSDFAQIKKSDSVLELGTGTGVISILLYAKKKPKDITAIEISEDMAEMAKRSVEYNKLCDYIKVFKMDLKEAPAFLGKGKYNAVVTNPPYIKADSGIISPDENQASARFEIYCTLKDVIDASFELLVPGGRFSMVHRTDRLVDILYVMRNKGLEPKRIRFIHSSPDKRPHLLLIEGVRGGKPELKFMEPLYIYDDKGNYTKEIYSIYGRME